MIISLKNVDHLCIYGRRTVAVLSLLPSLLWQLCGKIGHDKKYLRQKVTFGGLLYGSSRKVDQSLKISEVWRRMELLTDKLQHYFYFLFNYWNQTVTSNLHFFVQETSQWCLFYNVINSWYSHWQNLEITNTTKPHKLSWA